MSANGKFWANVQMLQSPQLQLYLDHNEKEDLERAVYAARSNNVLTGIDFRSAARVKELLDLAIERREASQKNYDTYRRASR
jgi:hypothetical protein